MTAIQPITIPGAVLVLQNELNSLINDNKSLRATVMILQGNADNLRELQRQNDDYRSKIEILREENSESIKQLGYIREENLESIKQLGYICDEKRRIKNTD